MLDVDSLLQPVSEESPSGEALDYDIDFLQLEISARGRNEQQIGDEINAAEEPDWPLVESLARSLSERSKDIRVAILLARALLHGSGFEGLEAGLRLLAGYVAQFWPSLHPVPEPDEDDTIRMNALAALSDPSGLLNEVRRAPLVRERSLGGVCLRDIQIASRELAPGSGTRTLAQADIEGAFATAPADEVAATAAALASCTVSIDAIVAATAEHDSIDLADQFQSIRKVLNDSWSAIDCRRASAPEPAETQVASEQPGAGVPVMRAGSGEIRGRSDVVAQIELICRWYATNEPASPVPVLLDRAKRLVSQDFLSLLMDLAPAGLEQFRSLAGLQNDAA